MTEGLQNYRVKPRILRLVCCLSMGLFVLLACQSATISEYHILPSYQGEELGRTATVRYVTDPAERARMKLYVRDGLLTDLAGQRLDPLTDVHPSRDGLAIFVMDRQRDIYVSFDHQQNRFHHSSILAGKPVLAAGDMTILDGKLLEISNSSGHYRPPARSLKVVIDRLTELGVDMTSVKVMAIDGSAKTSEKMK